MYILKNVLQPQKNILGLSNERDNLSEYRPRTSQTQKKIPKVINAHYDIYGNAYETQVKRTIYKRRNSNIQMFIEPEVKTKQRSITYTDYIDQTKKKNIDNNNQKQLNIVNQQTNKTGRRLITLNDSNQVVKKLNFDQKTPQNQLKEKSYPKDQQPYKKINNQFLPPNLSKNDIKIEQKDQSSKIEEIQQEPKIEQDKEEEEKCFKIDYNFLDKIDKNDPIFLSLFTDELINQINKNQVNLDQIIDDNEDYFHHILGNCACVKCSCGTCRCQFNKFKTTYMGAFQTQYNQQFVQQLLNNTLSPLNSTHYETFTPIQRKLPLFDPSHMTSYNRSYVKHPIYKKEPKPKHNIQERPLMSLTNYKKDFYDWKQYDPSWIFKQPQHVSTVQQPLQNQTTYKETIQKDSKKKKIDNFQASDIKKMQQGNPIPQVWKDDDPNYYKKLQNQWIDPKNNPNQNLSFKKNSETNISTSTPSFPYQFNTTFKKDYKGQQDKICQSRYNNLTKPWKIKLLNVLKEISNVYKK